MNNFCRGVRSQRIGIGSTGVAAGPRMDPLRPPASIPLPAFLCFGVVFDPTIGAEG
jgi:hypothetical protein